MEKLDIENLPKIDDCYLAALKDILNQHTKFHFDRDTVACLNDLMYLFYFRIDITDKARQKAKNNQQKVNA